MTQIPNVAEETKEKIKRSSAYSLPNNPTGAGYKAQDIKNALFKPIVDGQYSVLAEIEKLINELNKVLPSVKISEIKLENNTLQLVDDNMQVIVAINLPFVDRIEKANGEHAYVIINGEQTTKRISPTVENGAIVSRDPNGRVAFKDPVLSNEAVTKGYFENNVIDSFSYEMSDDYKIKLMLKNKSGKTIGEVEIDLPLESIVIGGEYNATTKKLILQLKSNDEGDNLGNTIEIDISDIVSGLVNESEFNALKESFYTHQMSYETKVSAITKEVGGLNNKVDNLEKNKQDKLTIVQTINEETKNSEDPVSAKAVYNMFEDCSQSQSQNQEYELIASLTVVPDTDGGLPNSIKISTDSDGNAFELTDFYIEANCAITKGNLGCMLNNNYVFGNATVQYLANTNLRAFALCYRYYGENEGGQITFPSQTVGSSFPNSNDAGWRFINIPPNFKRESSYKWNSIKAITLICTTTTETFINGSTFKLWGKRK